MESKFEKSISNIRSDNISLVESDCNAFKVNAVGKAQYWGEIGLFIIAVLVGTMILLSFFFEFGSTNFTIIFGLSIILYLVVVKIIWDYVLVKIADKTIELIHLPHKFDETKAFHAIIIAHKDAPSDDGTYLKIDYLDGVDILIQTFMAKQPQTNYSVYEVASKEELIPIIENPNAKYLWIFGHGKRTRVAAHNGGLCYFDVRSVEPKTFIGQYHCNSYYGNSLADYNHPEFSDVTRGPRWPPFIRRDIRKKIKEMNL